MDGILVVLPRHQDGKDYHKLILEWGGSCSSDPRGGGVIQRGEATIYCHGVGPASDYYSMAELLEFQERIGLVPQMALEIDISRSEGSTELALEFATSLVEHLGGLVDGNGVIDIEGGSFR